MWCCRRLPLNFWYVPGEVSHRVRCTAKVTRQRQSPSLCCLSIKRRLDTFTCRARSLAQTPACSFHRHPAPKFASGPGLLPEDASGSPKSDAPSLAKHRSREFHLRERLEISSPPLTTTTNSDKTNHRPHNLHNGRRLREPEL